MDELAACLRAWRDRLNPAAVGLPAGASRRAPGLRREEVAQLAGLSVDYLARLEQGRATRPSPQVLAALARTLRLSEDERDHLFRVAGHAPPESGRMKRHITPGVQRVLDRLRDVPVFVVDAAWEIVAWNDLAAALVGDFSARTGRERNIAWGFFTGAMSRVRHSAEEDDAIAAEAVADLHAALGRYPADPALRALVDDLLEASPRFAELWRTRPVAERRASRKVVEHPQVGRLTLDCDVLSVAGSDLRLIVYTAEPGSPDEAALAMVGALGLQEFAR